MASNRLTAEALRSLLGERLITAARRSSQRDDARLETDAVAERPVPSHATATAAGYAVASADIIGASPTAPVLLQELPVRVRIGDAMPSGCDAVIDPQTLDTTGGFAMVHAEANPGAEVRRSGRDLSAGHVIARAGAVLDRRLRAVLTAVGAEGGPGLSGWMEMSSIAPPDPASAAAIACLFDGTAFADGVRFTLSGDPFADVTKAEPGERRIADRIALRPAERTAVMTGPGGVRVILPARLDAALAVACLTAPQDSRLQAEAPLARKIASSPGLDEMALVVLENGRYRPLALGDWPLSAIAGASHILLVPPDSEGYPAGAVVSATPIGAM